MSRDKGMWYQVANDSGFPWLYADDAAQLYGVIQYPNGQWGVIGRDSYWTDEPESVCDTEIEAKAVTEMLARMNPEGVAT